MKPISPFELELVFLFNIKFDQWKEPAAAGIFFSLQKMLAQTSAQISPPKAKILATSLYWPIYTIGRLIEACSMN